MSRRFQLLAAFTFMLSALPAHAQRSYDTDILRDTFGFDTGGTRIAFTQALLENKGRHVGEFGELELTATLHDDGSVTLEDQHGERYVGTRLFWFAWYTFHPDTELVQ